MATPIKDIQFKDVNVFYNFIFDIGKTVNPIAEARRLLRTDLGIATPNYLTNEIEVASRFKSLLTVQESLRHLAELDSLLQKEGLKAFTKGVLRHPKLAFHIWRTMRRGRKPPRRPIEDTHPVESTDGRSREDLTRETIEFVNEAMIKAQSLMAVQLFSDNTLFSPIYLSELPFARVDLQPLFASVNGQEFAIDASVVIHRSGIAIISFLVSLQNEKTVDELIGFQRAGELRVNRLEIAKPVVDWQRRAHGSTESALPKSAKSRLSGGVEWLELENEGEMSLTDVMRLYQGAVIMAVHGRKPRRPNDPYSWARTQDWFVYPIFFIKETLPSFLTADELKQNFSPQIAGLVMKYSDWRKLTPELIEQALKRDFSLTTDKSVFINEGGTTVFYHGPYWAKLIRQFGADIPGQEWLFSHFQLSGLIDLLLVQRWILHTIRSELRRIKNDLDHLNSTKRTLILSLDEYRNMNVSYGSAQDIFKEGRKLMRIDELYDDVIFKLSSVEKLIDVAESRHRYRRDLFLRLAVMVVTLILGLPGTKQVVDIVSAWQVPKDNLFPTWLVPFIDGLLDHVRSRPVFSMLSLYGFIVFVLLFFMIWSLRGMKGRKPIVLFDQSSTAFQPNFTWPFKVDAKRTASRADESKLSAGDSVSPDD